MHRVIFCVLISVVCLVSSGCIMADRAGPHVLPHPHSELTAPTFCLYEGVFRLESEEHNKPAPINSIQVCRHTKINDEPIDWSKWLEYADIRPYTDQDSWEIEYAPDGKSDLPDRRFSCITYGKAPPGYIEKIPAQPLIPERLYTVSIRGYPVGGVLSFVIRVDSMGRPTHLEYAINTPLPGSRTGGVHVITRE